MNRISCCILGVLTLAAATTLSAYGQIMAVPNASALTKAQLSTLVSTAKTPADHERIAQYYQVKAQDFLAQAQVHQAMLAAYKSDATRVNNKNQASTIGHCEFLVQSLEQQAAKAQQLAQSHALMAAAEPPASPQQMAAAAQPAAQSMPGMDMSGAKAPAAKPTGMQCMMMSKMSGAPAQAKSGSMPGMNMTPAPSTAQPPTGSKADGGKPPCCCDGMK